jgi:hypothetical protein
MDYLKELCKEKKISESIGLLLILWKQSWYDSVVKDICILHNACF